MKILGPTWEVHGQPGKKKRGRGVSIELLSFSHYATRRVRDEKGVKPCSEVECGGEWNVAGF